MILGVIPARSGSISVKDKNIKPLGGEPLMAHTILTGLKCKLIDKLIVSTDSQEYAKIAESFGADVPFIRPEELATDTATTESVLKHALETIEIKTKRQVEIVVLLDPTSPFRTVEDINKCIQGLEKPETESVVTVCEVDHNPYFVMGTVNQDDYFDYPLIKLEKPIYRRQDAPRVYRLNAAVYAIKRELILREERFTNKTRVVEMPIIRSSHIDTLEDFLLAEFLIKEEYVKFDY